jgi:hypothetical protein
MVITLLRRFKIMGISIFDVIGTGIAAYILAYISNKYSETYSLKIKTLLFFILLIIFGIIIHIKTGTATMFNYYLGINTLAEVMHGRNKR